ncbi:thiamine phosphate synthase [Telmatospirillum sp.]|uniref:thiamine phosphate synthase n=1 Tax=Telmatospirillum sp. TaxID=2079197 RepID=UPI00284C3BD2|nr:thiamine phosphate synthase [Telmatospirillum sp.]MDR3439587.1 thiamine phosphate synthase [Telmatospirillum sp.]
MRTLADLASHLNFAGRRQGRRQAGKPEAALPPIILVTDQDRLPDPLPVAAQLPVGSLVIFRHYDDADRYRLAARLARLCRARRLHFLIAGDLDMAVSLGSGLHLPEGLVKQASARIRLWHRHRRHLLTAAAHGRSAVVSAGRLGADATLLSPVFPTASHPGKPGLGLLAFRRLARLADLAVFALGGVSSTTVRGLAGSGAAGVAAIGGLARRDPAGVVLQGFRK